MKTRRLDLCIRVIVVVALFFSSLPYQAIAAAFTAPATHPSVAPSSRERVSAPLPPSGEWLLTSLADVPFVGKTPSLFPRRGGTQPRLLLTPANLFEPPGFDTSTWAAIPSLLPRPRAVPSPNAPQPVVAPSPQPQLASMPLGDQQASHLKTRPVQC